MTRSKLNKRVLEHIVLRHPEVAPYANRILEAVEKPDLIVRGSRGEFKALRFYSDLHIGRKYLVVVYDERGNERIIITAYFTSNIGKVKGEVMWRKPQ
ncbi:MAG: hypothetical protein WED05_10005 [Candidatus Atabeyarchaeum deiterrae]